MTFHGYVVNRVTAVAEATKKRRQICLRNEAEEGWGEVMLRDYSPLFGPVIAGHNCGRPSSRG